MGQPFHGELYVRQAVRSQGQEFPMGIQFGCRRTLPASLQFPVREY